MSSKKANLDYTVVKYKNSKYAVIKAKYKGMIVPYVVDSGCLDALIKLGNKWKYKKSGGYISTTSKDKDGDNIEIFLHELIMSIKEPNVKNKLMIDHVNSLGIDNRAENLRYVKKKEEEENRNQKKKLRKTDLPKNSKINPNDIPTYVWYVKESGNHGDRFCVEIKDKVKWKTTSSKKVSLEYKLEEAKKYLRQLKKTNPELFEEHCMNGEYTKKGKELLKSFYDIIHLAGYKTIEPITMDKLTDKYIQKGGLSLNHDEIKMLNKREDLINEDSGKRRRVISNLPSKCGIKIEDLPKYSYYRPAYKNRGDYFVIENHPKQSKKLWQTTSSRSVSTKEKFDELLQQIKYLNKKKK